MPGPPPKRSENRRRRNKPRQPIESGEAAEEFAPPTAKKTWAPAVRQWYEALAKSGQSTYYEPSDWATAYLIAENMNRDFQGGGISGSSMGAYLRAMSSLLVLEGDRRRVQVELQRGKAEADDSHLPNLDDYRKRAGG